MTGSAKQSMEPPLKSGLLRRFAPRNDDNIESTKVPMSHVPKFHRLAVNDLRRESADAVSLTFTIPKELADDYRFAPGQYLTLRVTMDGEEVRRFCQGRIAHFKVPRYVRFVDGFPTTVTGKVMKFALSDSMTAELRLRQEGVA